MNQACCGEDEKGSVRRRGRRRVWGGLALALIVSACGASDSQPESGAAGGTADTAPAPPADTAPAPDSAAGAVMPADTSRNASPSPTQTARAEPAEKPAAKPQTKPKPAPQPAPQPSSAQSATQPEAAAQPEPAAPASDTQQAQAAQPPPQPATPQTPQDAPLRDEYHQAPKDTVSQIVYDGWKQYNLNCARCHGEDVIGTTIAPQLIASMKPNGPINTKEAFVQVVCAGRPEKGMPSWCSLGLEMDKINAIHDYVKGRSEGQIGPGRPAVKPEG